MGPEGEVYSEVGHDVSNFEEGLRKVITAILNVYRRPETLEKQIHALRSQTIPPKHIWIWQNKAPEKVKIKSPKKCVHVNSNYNFFYHGRFALALLAQAYTEYVAIFDDDIIPGNRWLENCLSCMEKQPGLYVGVGTRINTPEFQGNKRRWHGWRDPNEQIIELDYGGHAWFLKSEWLRCFWQEEQVCFDNAEDIQLSFALQKNMGLPTFVPPHPVNDTSLWSNTAGWDYGRSGKASHRNPATGIKPKEWFAQRRKIEQECIRRGWRPMYMREEGRND